MASPPNRSTWFLFLRLLFPLDCLFYNNSSSLSVASGCAASSEAHCSLGYCSRRQAERLLQLGRVTVNGCAATIGDKADSFVDQIAIDGNPNVDVATCIVLLNKPVGYLCLVMIPMADRLFLSCCLCRYPWSSPCRSSGFRRSRALLSAIMVLHAYLTHPRLS